MMAEPVSLKKFPSLTEEVNTSAELQQLLYSISKLYSMIVYVNLTKNTFKMMEYERFTTKKASVDGVFDDLVNTGSTTVDPLHRKLFLDTFSRENLLKAYGRGAANVMLDVRQLGDDGVYRWIKTIVVFLKNEENNDVIEITLSRQISDEKAKELENLRLRTILEMVLLAKYKYIGFVNIKTGRYEAYARDDSTAQHFLNAGDYDEYTSLIRDTLVSDDDREAYSQNISLSNIVKRMKENGGRYSFRYRLNDLQENHWCEFMCQRFLSDEDEFLLTIRDIQDEVLKEQLKQAEEELRLQQLLHGLGTDAPIGIISCDTHGNIIYVNQKAADTLGSPSVGETKKINLLTYPLLIEQGFSAKLEECLRSNKSIIDEFQYKSKWGKKVWLRIHIKTWMDLEKITGAQIVIDDISEKKHMEEELRNLSVTDYLTNIYNRRYFIGQLENEIERSKRFNGIFSLIMFDLDHFKNVNDTYGHNAGDILLRCVADAVKDSIRKIDCLARWGGEEFILLMPGTPVQKANILAERLRKKISEIHIPAICRITASFGVTEFCANDTADTVIQKADDLTYLAKARGRNRIAT